MEPEISTRCSQCGAAVRPHTLFCPECGQPADSHASAREQADGTATTDTQPDDGDDTAPETTEPDPPAAEEPVEAENVGAGAEESEQVAEDSDTQTTIEAEASAGGEEAEQAKDPLAEHLEKLKTAPEPVPGAIVVTTSRKGLKRKSSSSSTKKSKGRLVFSRFPSLRRADAPRPGRIEPGLRFLIVAAVLVAFALVAYYFSRYLR